MSFFYVFCNNNQVNTIVERVFSTHEKATSWAQRYSRAWYIPPLVKIVACNAAFDDHSKQWVLEETEKFKPFQMRTFTNDQMEMWEVEIQNYGA